MPVSSAAKVYVRSIIVALSGVVAAALGIATAGFFGDYFKTNPCYATIPITGSLGLDVYGAIIPVVAGLICAVLLLGLLRFPLKKFGVAFAASVVLAFLICRLTDEGLVGYPLIFAVATGLVSVAVNVYQKMLTEMTRTFVCSLLLALVCVPLTLFIADLLYSASFPNAVIGGNGLNDGIMISTLYSPFALTAIFSAFLYVSQTVLLIRKQQATSKQQSPRVIKPVLLE